VLLSLTSLLLLRRLLLLSLALFVGSFRFTSALSGYLGGPLSSLLVTHSSLDRIPFFDLYSECVRSSS
jgi:hypothetical protein